ncbi:MAG: hypothetical protein NZM29_03335 [Nitrospira sp.]|nr:hypothetical protein [Nitrospira sp.]
MLVWLFVLLALASGCVHRIHVDPVPSSEVSIPIPRSLGITVNSLALEGADHRPGITLLEWSRHDLQQAVVRYVERRKTFALVTDEQPDLLLQVTGKLTLISRQGRYHYHVRLRAEMGEGTRLLKTYVAEGASPGSIVRWVTASDRDPIESALQLALDSLFSQIESDRPLYSGPTEKPVQDRPGANRERP